MSHRELNSYRLPFWHNDRVLLGLLYVSTGLVVACGGCLRIWALWMQLQPHLPFSLPSDLAERIGAHMPQVLSSLVNVVASLAGLLLGIAWLVFGVGELIAGRDKGVVPGPLVGPEIVAEEIVHNADPEVLIAKTSSSTSKAIRQRPPRLSPVSKSILYGLSWSIFKLLVILLLVKVLFIAADYMPRFIQETTQTALTVRTPPASPLYFLLGLFIAADIIMALSLFPEKRRPLAPNVQIIQARGARHPRFLLSLFEESATIAAPHQAISPTKWRLMKVDNDLCYGSLVETVQHISISWPRLVVYPTMTISVFATAIGSYSLMNIEFTGSFYSVGQFAQEAALTCLVRVLFLILLVMLGGHLARWAQTFVRWTGWDSIMFLVVVWTDDKVPLKEEGCRQILAAHRGKRGSSWALQASPEEDNLNAFAHESQSFLVTVYWASAYSESSTPESQRTVVGSGFGGKLDERIDNIIEAPFTAHFEKVFDVSQERPNK